MAFNLNNTHEIKSATLNQCADIAPKARKAHPHKEDAPEMNNVT